MYQHVKICRVYAGKNERNGVAQFSYFFYVSSSLNGTCIMKIFKIIVVFPSCKQNVAPPLACGRSRVQAPVTAGRLHSHFFLHLPAFLLFSHLPHHCS